MVRPGDSVWSIARNFGVTPESIIDANKLGSSPELVIGQTLVIPSRERAYRVQVGDTIWSISRKFGVSPESIATLNDIQSPYIIYPGLVIRIPEKSKNYGYLEVNAFIQPSTPEKEKRVLGEAIEYLTYVTPFSHHVTADGGLTSLNDDTILQVARDNKVAALMSVTNISGDNFDTQLIDNILNNDQLQSTLISNILNLIKSKGYYGVVVDFERISPENREKYNNFLRKLVDALHPNYIVVTALAPKTYDVTTGSWHGAHDYKAHGEIVDFVIIMTYEWGYTYGPPMAVAPYNSVRDVLDYAVTDIDPEKIRLGVPNYGYNWVLPFVQGESRATVVGNVGAVNLARDENVAIEFDEEARAPFFTFYDEDRREHIVWFEDARSIDAKLRLIEEYGLNGASYWTIMREFPQNWLVVISLYNIIKLI